MIRQRFLDSNGNPLAGGKLYAYVAGTSTPQDTYTDQSGDTENANPVVLDANGEANVWIDSALAYKFVLKDADDVTQWTVDGVTDPNSAEIPEWSVNATYSQGSIVRDSSGAGLLYVSLTDSNAGNLLSSVGNWRMFDGAVRTVTGNTTLAVTDNLVRSNSTAGSLTHTLPACSTTPIGKRITVKDVGTGGNTTSVRGNGSDTVDGDVTFATALRAGESITVMNMGTRWDLAYSYLTKDGSISTAKIADNAVTRAKLEAVGHQISGSSGLDNGTSTSYTDVTNLSVTITTTGRPVFVGLISDGTSVGGTAQSGGLVGVNHNSSGTAEAAFTILRDGVSVAYFNVYAVAGGASGVYSSSPCGSIFHIDTPAAGTYTYKLQRKSVTSTTTSRVHYAKLVAYEF